MATNLRKYLTSVEGYEFLAKEYGENERSVHDIAKQLGTYPNMVVRCLKQHHIQIRDKSQSQKLALKSGRATHPRKKTDASQEN